MRSAQQGLREFAVPLQPSLGAWDTFLDAAQTHTFCISGMAFQDAWTLDLERLRDCCIHVLSGLMPLPAGPVLRLQPDRTGQATPLYRFAAVEHQRVHHA